MIASTGRLPSTAPFGFTLIELLIAVAIIGVLAAIVSANYVLSIERADAAACQENLRTVFTALQSYRLDYNRFPPADGAADVHSQSNHTAWGCGPSANGYWSGVSLLLSELGYCSEEALYCPALKRAHSRRIEAYPTCDGSSLAGKTVPQWRFLRFAYNNAAADAGGSNGGENNIETEWKSEVWLVRCLHLDISEFDKERAIRFPFRIKQDEKNPNRTWYGEFELTVLGTIRLRPVCLE
ncbi:MAG: type II secretion system protein [Candidatus Omnitrophota bacterium]